MNEFFRQTSPDGLLTLVGIQDTDGDITIGFEGFYWHTHGDLLATPWLDMQQEPLDPHDAAVAFISSIVTNQVPLVLHFISSKLKDVWGMGPGDMPPGHGAPDDSFEIRYWDGTQIDVADLIDRIRLFDADDYYRRGYMPWSFLAWPTSISDEDGLPRDMEALRLLSRLQFWGICFGTWRAPDEVGQPHTWAVVPIQESAGVLEALAALETEGDIPRGHVDELTERLMNMSPEPDGD